MSGIFQLLQTIVTEITGVVINAQCEWITNGGNYRYKCTLENKPNKVLL